MKKEKNEIKIRISGLSSGVHEYHFDVEPADLALPEGFLAPITADVIVDKDTRQIYVRAKLSASSEFICDRCLEPLESTLPSELSLVFVYDEMETGKFTEDEVRIIAHETPYIDLTEDARQAVLLSVPLKLLCREDCKGLCPHCGVNWNTNDCTCTTTDEGNTDTRWENLKNIL